jgi:hypothetical protein
MSERLAISSAFSVLMMASYVLFGGDSAQVRLEAQANVVPQISVPAMLPRALALLPS